MSEPTFFYDTRQACGKCARFIREDAIRWTDYRDDSYYFGIRTEEEYDCSRCGTVKASPAITQVRAIPYDEVAVTFDNTIVPERDQYGHSGYVEFDPPGVMG